MPKIIANETVNGTVDVSGDLSTSGKLFVNASAGDEGGEIFLNKSVTNTTITGGVTIDVYQNRLRFFEQGGTARGYYLDITGGGAGVATNLGSGTIASSRMPAGSIINVQSVTSTTQTSYSGGTTFQTILGMSLTLTPRNSSSKFLLMASINHANSADGAGFWNFFRFARGGTGIGVGTGGNVYSSTAMIDPPSSTTVWTTSFQYFDSPATASAVTYTVQAHPYDTRTMYVNRRAGDTTFNTMSTFVVMEIAG